jgi:hypothetical protein
MLKNFVERILNGLLLETPGDDGAGGGGTGDGTPGAGNDGKPQPDGKEKPVAGRPDSGGNRRPEDDPRYKGMLADLQKERASRQKFEKDHAAALAELETERKRVRSLAGLETPSPEQEDDARIRSRMEALYPWMKDLTAEDIQAIRESRGQMDEIRGATLNTWKAHGTKMLSQVTSGVQKALGGKLSERQIGRLQSAYLEEAQNNKEFLARHEAGDPTLVDEFVSDWLGDWVEPGRRSAQAETVQRRQRVPSGKDRSIVGANEKPIDLKDPKAVEDILVAGFKNRGGQFGRR